MGKLFLQQLYEATLLEHVTLGKPFLQQLYVATLLEHVT